ncbi:hypothetical protein RRG08_061375 [Elysia crispata]|uniref:Uncharacterized protein n=1 Tax=Elysia crispata TaxID=231223 RepID=A0AAE1DXP2_9GAST|nr:hypothetical protein RRG08_061375 [Elysia crispata]
MRGHGGTLMSVSVSMSVRVTRYTPENTERGTGEGKELLHVRLSVVSERVIFLQDTDRLRLEPLGLRAFELKWAKCFTDSAGVVLSLVSLAGRQCGRWSGLSRDVSSEKPSNGLLSVSNSYTNHGDRNISVSCLQKRRVSVEYRNVTGYRAEPSIYGSVMYYGHLAC